MTAMPPPSHRRQEPATASERADAERSRTAEAGAAFARALAADGRRLARRIGALVASAIARLSNVEANRPRVASVGRRIRETAARLAAAPRRLPRRRRGIASVAAAVLVAVVGAAAILVWALRDLPPGSSLAGSAEPSVVFETADGGPLARKGPLKLADASLADFPKTLVDAVISIEDRRFYTHWGLDSRGIFRALARNVSAGEVVEGGSTINQQLVKILHLERDRTLKRKVREAAIAVWLDLRLEKNAILTSYLNNIYLGAGATGVPAAARVYFDKIPAQLTLAESALLAGLIKAPSQLNPLKDIEAARDRAATVLDAMVAAGRLDPETANAAKNDPATLAPSRIEAHTGTWFADWVAKEAAEIAGSFRGTMRVRTTLHPELQAAAETAVSAALDDAGAEHGATQAALVALRPDGAVLAMVGGRRYEGSEFNRAVDAMRQPGSAFKLFVYYAALRNGLSPADRIEDSPLEIDGWAPKNFSDDYRGRVSLAEAFARSLNTAAVRLALEVGLGEVVAAARDLGIDAPLAETPSLALGAAEVSLLDLTGAYASVRAGATPIEPWGIAAFGPDGESRLFKLGPSVAPERALGPYHEPLVGLLKLVVDKGTGRAAALDGFAAGKTGTSQNHRDAWFVGFNEDLVVGVWVGNDDEAPMDEVTGGKLPAMIWRDFMTRAMAIAKGESPARDPAARQDGVDVAAGETPAPQCDYRACARAYRSFRSTDCTFQPYRGSRKLCEK
jgi:1A family penicillin-binding protein